MAKAKKKEVKRDVRKGEIAKAAAKTGKLAAKVERIAREAVDRAVHASAIVADAFGRPDKVVGAIGSAASAGQDALAHMVDERLKATIAGLGLATLGDLKKLTGRVSALEKATKPAASKAAARKPAAKKPAAKKRAARKAPARRASAKAPAAR